MKTDRPLKAGSSSEDGFDIIKASPKKGNDELLINLSPTKVAVDVESGSKESSVAIKVKKIVNGEVVAQELPLASAAMGSPKTAEQRTEARKTEVEAEPQDSHLSIPEDPEANQI